ncbi:uncharacterized protein BO96DRAFT_406979 [Aspergillus niger CBS 101883]|uniref:uncharacterized protein n=1 Tax=Aspergillus lacticoffeatus (strain CBS 101883) TaxID=1450533 RepID=UPI000D7FBAF3|nr:uncharacterized protein BO96DRAFT_406979 [Aspergillus niger CBS 101883]PYH62285.1 hypothetical protein BO96DRAFT_406979 [Aspergillus niger CBS 101883]
MVWSGWYILGIRHSNLLRPSIQFPRDYWVYTENAVDALSIYDGVSSTLLVPRLWVSSLHTTHNYGIDLVE